MNYDLTNFTGEINQSLPAHYKIPTKSAASREKESIKDTTTNAVTKEHEAAAKAFLTQTIGEINQSLSTNYIIPTKSVASCEIDATANVANQHEAAAKAFLTQTLGNCGPLGSTPYNPMDYYEEPDWDNAPSEKPDLKRKNNEPFVRKRPGDDALPVDLTKLMLPLACDLCTIKMNSNMSAKMHYDSKNHDKKVNAWLLEWSKKTGEPLPKRGKMQEGPAGPNAFHCDVCDLALTSLQHANQHYMGKRHRMILAGKTNPHGSGYYGTDGKWIRTNTKPQADVSGRFHIGSGFVQPAPPPPPVISTPNGNDDPDKYCSICKISVTSKPQMRLHLEGSKHAKKLKASGEAPQTFDQSDTILQSLDKPVVMPKVAKTTSPATKQRDISIYRTPSGSFYCKPCNLTLATEVLFNQHLDSKKHIKSVNMSSH